MGASPTAQLLRQQADSAAMSHVQWLLRSSSLQQLHNIVLVLLLHRRVAACSKGARGA
jgi:hypothetical protein